MALVAVAGMCFFFGIADQQLVNRIDSRAQQSPPDSDMFAQALEKVYQMNLSPAVSADGVTRPDLCDRMSAAGIAPNVGRPLPPSRRLKFAAAALMLAPMILGIYSWGMAASWADSAADSDEDWQMFGLVMQVNPGWRLNNLGLIHYDQEKYEEAILLLRAATELDSTDWNYSADLSQAYLKVGGYDAAEVALLDARARQAVHDPKSSMVKWLDKLARRIENARRGPIAAPPEGAVPEMAVPQPAEPQRRRRRRGRNRRDVSLTMATWLPGLAPMASNSKPLLDRPSRENQSVHAAVGWKACGSPFPRPIFFHRWRSTLDSLA
jgi:hypothetical protein